LVATNSPTEGDGSPDLFILRQGSLVFHVLSPFGLWWGRGETGEVSVDLRWGGGGFGWWKEVSFRS
jgi:hypothetical protein